MAEETGAKSNLSDLIDRAENHLRQLKYLEQSVMQYRRIWNKLEKYAQSKGIQEFSIDSGNQFLRHQYGLLVGEESEKIDHVRSRAIRILSDYQQHGAIIKKICKGDRCFPVQFEGLFNDYILGLEQNGLSKNRVQSDSLHLKYWGSYLDQKGVNDFSDVRREDVTGFILTLTSFARSTISNILKTVRKLLLYAYEKGLHAENLSDACPKILRLQNTKIPSAYTHEEVDAILNAVDRGNAAGKRDYAILLLAARFGIRAGDIRELIFSNFDWETGKFSFIQEKTKKPVSFDITEELGQAIIDYLKYGRPESNDERVFIRHTAPFESFCDTYKFYNIINKYMVLAGIKIPAGKRHGLHSLRHSLASRMLEQQVPITTIADVLSHNYIDTSAIYTKIDIAQLRYCALEVPYEAD